jgi:methyl-accepting chemotaxis protein
VNSKEHSLTLEFTGIFLAGVLVIVLLVSVDFISAFSSLSRREIENRIITNTKHLRDRVEAQMQERVDLLNYTGMGALPMMTAEILDEQALETYFRTMTKTKEDVQLLFSCSPGLWNEPGGFIVFGDGWKPANDYDNRIRSWWSDAMAANGKTIFTEPYVDLITNQLVVTLSKLAFDDHGRPAAVMGEDISMGKLNGMANDFSETASMQSFFLHQSGKYITNPDNEAIMQRDFFNDYGLEAFRGNTLGSSNFLNNGDVIICSEPVAMTGWTLVSVIPTAAVFADLNRVMLRTVVIEACSILVFIALLILIIRRMIKPIINVTQELKAISEGEGDLTRYITVKSTNEIGVLTRYFNQTLEKIKKMIMSIKKQTGILFETGEELSGDMTETVAVIDQITANIQSIRSNVTDQSARITETYTNMEQINVGIEKLNGYVEKQTKQVGDSEAAIGEMIANIQSVVLTLEKNRTSMQELLEASETGRNGILAVTGDIQEIAKESEGLLEINTVMENIASQTNLLSMNAAIEAAHAGEAGKGFAVVADEIRKLAEDSSEQSKTINMVLKKIRASIDKIVESANNVFQEFDAIEGGVKVVSKQVGNIRGAMEEQNIEGKKILDVISSLNIVTRHVENSSMEMLERGQRVINGSKRLESLTAEITNGMNEIVTGAERISATANRTNQISGQNAENIDLLTREVSKFKV